MLKLLTIPSSHFLASQWDSELEESDVELDSSEDDSVAVEPAPKARPAPNKASMKVDKLVSKLKSVHQYMSDDASDGSVPPKKPAAKARNKALGGAKKTTKKRKKNNDDVSSTVVECDNLYGRCLNY